MFMLWTLPNRKVAVKAKFAYLYLVCVRGLGDMGA